MVIFRRQAFQPEFVEPITNLTVPIGRNATFRCLVQNLGGYRVGWVKADTKAIQAIHVHVITNNHRVGVSHNGQTVWNLHIRNVQEEDRGQYMCQINTDPMKSQMGYLDVVIPPDFIPEETSINMSKEEVLTLSKVSRSDMGAYLCIASNGVPPTVSKRILIKVHFHPVIQVPNQLVGAPLGTDVTLECYVESSPKSINYWNASLDTMRSSGNEMVISSNKYEVMNVALSSFESRMTLTVRRLTAADVGGYRCVAKNSLGEVDSVIRLYEIPGPTAYNTSPRNEEYKYSTPIEGPDNQFGSADRSDDEEDRESTFFVTDKTQIRHVLENNTRNRSFVYLTSSNTIKQKLSNKVSKILNQLEIEDSDFEINYSNSLGPMFVLVLTLISIVFRLSLNP
ncbi:hypothetical protein MSG28_010918 [Choristoneura fumiferana]|uniref:Uncharacterized protein n=1 Tax=Choristoneura fumiferana TaxID=7141 RepID=A0ACC0KPW0_CHOFU|nr:hypothetical protein MSG28_010918 [Choristoneura fumiferana]